MKFAKTEFSIIEQEKGLTGIYKHIEFINKMLYNSKDKVNENNFYKILYEIVNKGYTSLLEHITIYLYSHQEDWDTGNDGYVIYISDLDHYKKNKYSYFYCGYVTTNLKVLVDNNWLHDLKYLCKPTKYHKQRKTIKLICDKYIASEFSKQKDFVFDEKQICYNDEITFIIPSCTKLKCVDYSHYDGSQQDWFELSQGEKTFINICNDIQRYYRMLTICCDWDYQDVSYILPNSLKTEIIMTGFVSDWKKLLNKNYPKISGNLKNLIKEMNKLKIFK